MCGNAPHALCAGSKSSPQAQKLSASRRHARTREERIHYRPGRRGRRHDRRSSPVCRRGHPAGTLSDVAHDTRSLQCVAHRGEAPYRPYATSPTAGRGGPMRPCARRAAAGRYAALLAVGRSTSKPSAPSASRRLPSSRGALVATIVLFAYADGSTAFAYASCRKLATHSLAPHN